MAVDTKIIKNNAKEIKDNIEKIYDVIVIGGGPAGYTAAMYTVRAGLDTMVLEKMSAGGQMTQTTQIDNYPGFENGIEGFELGKKMQEGAERFGAQTKITQADSAELTGAIKKIKTKAGVFLCKSVVIATGAAHKHLGIENEEKYIGAGVAYCAACDGMFYKNKTVAVVGGGNSAAADALLLSKICKKVILIHRRDKLRASKIYQEQLFNRENIEFCWNMEVNKLLGENRLSGVQLREVNTDEVSIINVDGLFVSIGQSPATELFSQSIELDKQGYIVANETTKTNIDGVFAAGDVRTKPLRQIITAASDGAVAAYYAEEYLLEI